jgi:spartin
MVIPEAFLLLTIPNVTLKAENTVLTGTVALQCVTIPVPLASSETNRDVYLVLRLDSYEIPLDPARVVECTRSTTGERAYIFHESEFDPTKLELTTSSLTNGREDPSLSEDLETFEQIIAQYANFPNRDAPPSRPELPPTSDGGSADLRGRLVLVNQDSGEVVGEVDPDRKFAIQEDPKLNEKGRESDAVVIDIPDVRAGLGTATAHDPLQVYVDVIPPGQEDWIMKSATAITQVVFTLFSRVHLSHVF